MLIKRSQTEIIDEAVKKIAQNTPITNFHAGAIARSLVEAIGPEYPTLYDFAEDVLNQGYLSRANVEHLELIGTLFNYPRRLETIYDKETGEYKEAFIDVETYRYELSQQVHTAVSSNYESLRLACLTTSGVQSIVGKEYSHGTGSFSFIIIPLYGFDEETVLAAVHEVVDKTKAFGVKPTVLSPIEVPIEIKVKLLFHEVTSDTDKELMIFDAKSAIHSYFGNFELGQGFVYNDFVQEVMNVNKNIIDFEVVSFYLNNGPALLTNQTILDDERIRPRLVEIV